MEMTRRKLIAAGGLGALFARAGTGSEAEAASSANTEQERAAMKVVSDFIATFPSRDVNRLGTFMADDCEFQGAPWTPLIHGKQNFMAEMKGLVDPKRGLIFAKSPSRLYAIGGEYGTGVLAERIDYRNQNPIRLAGLFWVVDGKIQAWHDALNARRDVGNTGNPGVGSEARLPNPK